MKENKFGRVYDLVKEQFRRVQFLNPRAVLIRVDDCEFGLSLNQLDEVGIFLEPLFPEEVFATLSYPLDSDKDFEDLKENLTILPKSISELRNIYLTLVNIGRSYIDGFSVNKLDKALISKQLCKFKIGIENSSVSINVSISVDLSQSDRTFNVYTSYRKRLFGDSKDIYQDIIHAKSGGIDYISDPSGIYLVKGVSTECKSLCDIDWNNLLNLKLGLDIFPK